MSELKPCPFCGDIRIKQYGGELSQESPITVCSGCFTQVIGHELWNNRPHENKIKADAFIAGAEWQDSAQFFDYDIGIDIQRKKAASEYADKLERGER